MGIAGAIGEHGQDVGGRDAVSREGEILLRRLVDPVEVFIDDRLGARRGDGGRQAAEGVEEIATALLGIHGEYRRIPRVDGEEVAEEGQRGPELVAEREDRAFNLLDDHRVEIALLDPEASPEQVDQRVERNRPAERQAASLEPADRLTEPAVQLVEEPGFSNPGLADDEHDLTVPIVRLFKPLEEHAELPLPTHERGQPAFSPDFEAGPGSARAEDLPARDPVGLALEL